MSRRAGVVTRVAGEDVHICTRDLEGVQIGDLIQIFPQDSQAT